MAMFLLFSVDRYIGPDSSPSHSLTHSLLVQRGKGMERNGTGRAPILNLQFLVRGQNKERQSSSFFLYYHFFVRNTYKNKIKDQREKKRDWLES